MSPNLIQPNVECRIRSIEGDSGARLTQMGILPGVEMRIVRTSPFGNGTVEVMIGGADVVALRSDEIVAMECDLVAVPLSSPAIEQADYRVSMLAGGQGFKRRMAALGVVEGARVQVISTLPLLISAQGKQVRLGRGEADKVVVEEVADES
ncbi:MAG: FeoA domain-containing protein [Acidimicrobiia bacterium]